jgi:hypothetical protein
MVGTNFVHKNIKTLCIVNWAQEILRDLEGKATERFL